MSLVWTEHCFQSLRIKFGVFTVPCFDVFGLSTVKYGPEKTLNSGSLHAVSDADSVYSKQIQILGIVVLYLLSSILAENLSYWKISDNMSKFGSNMEKYITE